MAMTVSELQVKVSADVKDAESGLSSLGSKIGSVGGSLATAFGGVAIAGIAGLTAGLTSAVGAAATFESGMSAIKAVSGATAAEMDLLRGKALDLGAATSFSATEAAGGMEELLKAGVSVGDVMGGGAAAALNLAAAGAVSVGEAATITSDAMNMFGLKGSEAAHVADLLAGASVASSADVHGLGQGLSAVGAVAHVFGLSLDDTTTALAVMAQAGVKGSDAGTSLKTMLLNLTPSTKAQIAVAKELGIVTADGANKFFDATGKAKSMSEISDVLQEATKGLTDQQKAMALQTLFGTDAIRAGVIMSEAGAEGFNKMAEAQSKIGADEVAKTRLDNLKGSIEQLKGSLETAAIQLGTLLLPGIRGMVDGLTEGVNKGIDIIKRLPGAWEDVKSLFAEGSTDANLENLLMDLGLSEAMVTTVDDWLDRIGNSWRTMQQVFAGDWSPSNQIDPFVNKIGIAALAVKGLSDKAGDLGTAIATATQKAGEMGAWDNLGRAMTTLRDTTLNIPTRLDEIATALGRLNGASGGTSTKVDVLATAIKVFTTNLELMSLATDTMVNSVLKTGAVFVNWVSILANAGRAVAALATGDMAGLNRAVDGTKEAFGGMLLTTVGWANDTEAAVRKGARAIGVEVEEGTTTAQIVAGIKMAGVAKAVESNMSAANTAVSEGSAGWQQMMEANGAGAVAATETSMVAVVTATDTGMTGTVAAVQAAAPAAGAAAEAMGTGMAAGIESAAPQMTAAAETGASGAVAAVQGQTGAASGAGQSLGEALGSGLEGGIMAYVGRVANAAAQLVSSAIGAARQEADAHSPSKKTEKLGQDMAEGLEVGLSKSNLGAEMQAQIRDFIEANRAYIPVAGQIARVEGEIKRVRDESQTAALFRSKEMIDVDSETLRLKQDQVKAERELLPLRREIAGVGREIADAERGSLDARRQSISLGATNAQQNIEINNLEKEKIPLRARELEIERLLIGIDPNSKRAKGLKEEQEELRGKNALIDNTISQIRLQTRAQELDLASYKESRTVESAGARIRQEELGDRLRGQEINTTAIKDEIAVLDAERAVFSANEALIKNATDNEIAYRNRLIAVFTAEGKPLADRITAGKLLLEQLHDEGKISDELYNAVKKATDKMGDAKGAAAGFGNAAATASPQIDGAARSAGELASEAAEVARRAGEAEAKMSELAKASAKYAREHGSLFDPRARSDAAAGGSSYGGSTAIDGMAIIGGNGRGDTVMPANVGAAGGGSGAGATHTYIVRVVGPDDKTLAEWVARGGEMATDLGLRPRR